MNRNKLRGRIIEIYGTQGAFAEILGVEPNTVSYKLNNKREMSRSEITRWSELLQIPREEIGSYFFKD